MVFCPLPCAFVRAVIIDCFSRTYNCFIARNWLNVVTDLIGSSYLRFTYSVPGLSLGHLSFFLQMIWWQCTAIQVFISQQMIWSFFFAATSQKRDKIRGNAFITALQGVSVRESGREVSWSCTVLTREDAPVGSPVPFVMPGMKALHHHPCLPCFHAASCASSNACYLSCLLLSL